MTIPDPKATILYVEDNSDNRTLVRRILLSEDYDVLEAVDAFNALQSLPPETQVLDARSRERFEGTAPEPRSGVRSGHIPGSRNLPYTDLVRPDGTLRPPGELRSLLSGAGIDAARPVVTSCGSGVSACAVTLALEVAGFPGHAVYDGSWAEWGSRIETPVEQGPPA
jgi:thiosulfate/3-mercaptopyruvate sulfurtransferase